MNCVTKALDDLKFKIPRPILEAVFTRREWRQRDVPQNIDQQVMTHVIRPRVMMDVNIAGGREIYVPLERVMPEQLFDETGQYAYTSVYRIPKELTGGGSIMSVLNLTFSDPTAMSSYANAAGIQNGTMLRAAENVMNAQATIPVTSTARCDLIGENVVMVRDSTLLPANIYMRVLVGYDELLSAIHIRSYRHFSNLVTLAVKAFIYNEYLIKMDMGELMGGQALGSFKDVISGYADANELYETYLVEKWTKVAFMNDSETNMRFLRTIIGGAR
jgi:hypothetical protein